MHTLRNSLRVLLCGAVLSLVLAGCNSAPDVKQAPGSGAKGLTEQEKRDKKGDQ